MTKELRSSSSRKASLFVYKYKNKRVLATRETRHDDAVQVCRALFYGIPDNAVITFHTKDLDVCEGEMTEISERSWKDVIEELKSVTVMVEERSLSSLSAGPLTRPLTSPEDPSQKQNIVLVVCYNNIRSTIKVSLTQPLRVLYRVLAKQTGLCEGDWMLYFNGSRITYDDTVASLGIQENDQIDCMQNRKGGKPVIYLFSPVSLEASVKLSLVPQWELSAIYPVVPIKLKTMNSNEEVSWSVRVHPNGELTELTTGLDIAYLFWEAHTDPTIPPLPPPAPIADEPGAIHVEVFNPSEAVLSDDNSVVVSVDKITPYLDRALFALGLHTEARTSFITYWLPSLLKHKNVAFRFIPQASYERAAPLEVSPSPDVTTRVFMIFQGVEDEELGEWPTAIARAGETDVSWWKDVVGVDLEQATNKSLFRVLEWGGMEVLRAQL